MAFYWKLVGGITEPSPSGVSAEAQVTDTHTTTTLHVGDAFFKKKYSTFHVMRFFGQS